MDKSSFLSSTEASTSVAEAAWSRADGDEAKARELLELVRYDVKGKFSDPDEEFYGLFTFAWDVDSASASKFNQAVLGDGELANEPITSSRKALADKIERLHQDGSTMGGYSSELKGTLESELADQNSELHQALSEGDFAPVDDRLTIMIGEALDLDNLNVSTEIETVRKIETMKSQSQQKDQKGKADDDVTIKVSAEINPVRGRAVSKINPGDKIFVRPGSEKGADRKPVREAKKYANDEGLVAATVLSKESSAAGSLRMEVELPNGVYGKLKISKDVSILAPDTPAGGLTSSSSDIPAFLKDEIVLGTSLAIIILTIVGLWLFL